MACPRRGTLRPVALTRRTPAFAQLAQDIERILEGCGASVSGSQVDAVVNLRVEQVAQRMGVTTRTALQYAPTDLPETTARLILEVLGGPGQQDGTKTRGHLRLIGPADR